jgi:hypothetical protein
LGLAGDASSKVRDLVAKEVGRLPEVVLEAAQGQRDGLGRGHGFIVGSGAAEYEEFPISVVRRR